MNDHTNDKSKEHDYLWDRSGAPDPEIYRLESLLSEFRLEDRPLVLSAQLPVALPETSRGALLQFLSLPRLAAAAIILLAFSVGFFFALRPRTGVPSTNNPSWEISNLRGAPQVDSETLSAASKLFVGQTLSTDSSSHAWLSEKDLGEIQVDPNSRLRLLQSGPERKRIQLELGTIHAYIWAPPAQFVVETPSAVAVDLGCAYTLRVDPAGTGTIRTTLGWVGFHSNGHDSFIPAGAMCATRPHAGPGAPYFESASPAFRQALADIDSAAPDSTALQTALAMLLPEARPKDALTLWHLLSRTSANERAQVYDRLAALVPPPTGVTRERVLQLDPQALDLYWNALHLGDMSIWRFWEQSSAPTQN
jgi:FecR protein